MCRYARVSYVGQLGGSDEFFEGTRSVRQELAIPTASAISISLVCSAPSDETYPGQRIDIFHTEHFKFCRLPNSLLPKSIKLYLGEPARDVDYFEAFRQSLKCFSLQGEFLGALLALSSFVGDWIGICAFLRPTAIHY